MVANAHRPTLVHSGRISYKQSASMNLAELLSRMGQTPYTRHKVETYMAGLEAQVQDQAAWLAKRFYRTPEKFSKASQVFASLAAWSVVLGLGLFFLLQTYEYTWFFSLMFAALAGFLGYTFFSVLSERAILLNEQAENLYWQTCRTDQCPNLTEYCHALVRKAHWIKGQDVVIMIHTLGSANFMEVRLKNGFLEESAFIYGWVGEDYVFVESDSKILLIPETELTTA